MLRNYFLIAVRTLLKNKVFTVINILGLSIGISAALIIYLLVHYHFTFDKFEKDNDRLYRVVSNFNFSGELYHNPGVCDPMATAVRTELTGVDEVVPFRTWPGDVRVSLPGTGKPQPVVFKKQKSFVFADSNFFNLMGYTWLAGSSVRSLSRPYNIVLTEMLASLYFPDLPISYIIGKEILLDDTTRVTVSGIVKNIEKNTDFNFTAFIAYVTLENSSLKPENWNEWGSTTDAQQLLVKLGRNTSVPNIEKQIAQLYAKNHKIEPGDNGKTWHTLQPFDDIHFNADYRAFNSPTAHKPTLYGLLAIAAFLLLLGCINFINLTTAYASRRSKEIGIRKTMGGSRKQLVLQFLSETFLLTLAAAMFSIFLIPFVLNAFSGFIPAGLHFDVLKQPQIIAFLSALILIVTILAGFYPAFILSAYKPVLVLKNQAFSNTGKTRNAWLRKSLTVSQFVIAQVFIMCTLLIGKQITYSLNKDLGFKKDAIVYIRTNYYDTVKTRKYVLIDKLKAIPEIAMVSLSSDPPSSDNTWSGSIKYKNGKEEIEVDAQQKFADTNFIKLYRLKLIAGNNYTQTDTVTSLLINETYARILRFQPASQGIGKYLEWSDEKIPIVGVVADFHQKSLREPIKPMVIGSWESNQRCISIALQAQQAASGTWKTVLEKIEAAWKQVYPQDDFEYTFFDKDIEKFYEAEQHVSGLLTWATCLAIFISCLGLLGLVIYTTEQRTKEIGVRKVLGASVPVIVAMISREFIILVVTAFVIAVPLASLGMHKWLENFTYRTGVSWWIFVAAGILMTAIALLTLSFQTIRAAMANPVKSLRSE